MRAKGTLIRLGESAKGGLGLLCGRAEEVSCTGAKNSLAPVQTGLAPVQTGLAPVRETSSGLPHQSPK